MSRYKVLAVNPGSTSTKFAVFEEETVLFEKTLRHDVDELKRYAKVIDQYDFRKKAILECLQEANIDIAVLDAAVGRGGLLHALASGTYRVNDAMISDLFEAKYGEHASNLGALLAKGIGDVIGKDAYIVDPVIVDEMSALARVSGNRKFQRKSIFHALNQKAIGRKAARDLGTTYEALNLIVAHMGGGVSVGAHCHGLVVDVNNALNGEGAFSPERSGTLPAGEVAELCFSGQYTLEEVKRMLAGSGGLISYFDTNDAKKISERAQSGDEEAAFILEAMTYQVSKDIGQCAAVLSGKVDAIVLTGGIAYDKKMVEWIKERVSFIAPVMVYPGEDELLALAQGCLRVLKGEEKEKEYECEEEGSM